jgi:hypothetical protein
MLRRTFQLVLAGCLLAATSLAANDPFVGKWKLNPSKSKLTDQMKVDSVGGNKYAITFGPGAVDTVVADGSDQPGLRGTTLSVAVEGPNKWKVVRKKEGRMLIAATWTLSEDDKTLTDDFKGFQPDGSTFNLLYVYQRTAGESGFPGTWESVSEQMNSAFELDVQPYEGDGLSFLNPAQKSSKNIKFDGRDYPDIGPNAAGMVSAGRRVNTHDLEITDKFEGKVTDNQEITLSTDLKTLTMTVRRVGQNKPNVLVFDRE